VGEKVAAKILSIGGEVAFVEMGSGTADGMIAVVELMDADGVITYREGDIVDAVVVKGGERGVEISRGMASKGARERQVVYDAFKTGLPVEGLVKAVNKGGLEVEVAGQRAFCPTKQVDIRFVEDLTKLVGQRLAFRVQTADDRDIVLSRRALLEEEREQKVAVTRARLEPGATFEGVVTHVRDFGAFVDIGGIEGLVHVSELAWERVGHPADKVKAGDTVTVQVLKIEPPEEKAGKKGADKERISLSIKALTPAPERPAPALDEAGGKPAAAMAVPRVGDVVDATVDKIEPFGLFVKFGNGRGLVPAAETGTPRGADLRKAFKVGDPMKCLILEQDDRGRLRLSKAQAEVAEERREAQAFMRESSKKGKQGFGTLGDLLAAKLKK
jgi:small subunit ribosomal protein S1